MNEPDATPIADPAATAAAAVERPWPVRAMTLLLLGQIVGLLVLDIYHIYTTPALDGVTIETLPLVLVTSFRTGIVLTLLVLLASLATISFLGLWRSGWTLAMLLQGLILLYALVIYSLEESWLAYPLMVSGIFMVFYLYHPDIRTTFPTSLASEHQEQET